MSNYEPAPLPIPPQTWTRQDSTTNRTYLISTRREYLSPDFINDALSTDDMPWAKRLSSSSMSTLLNNSLTLGLYLIVPVEGVHHSDVQQIGMARLITDYVTMAYLTDVYVDPAYRHNGLAEWLVVCCKEAVQKIAEGSEGGFRRLVLFSSHKEFGIPFYGKHFGAEVHDQDSGTVFMSTKPGMIGSGQVQKEDGTQKEDERV